MIVVEPTSARFEVSEQSISTEEHLLERISIVESRLSRLTERLERSLDLLLRQAQNSYFDRSLVKTLIGLLTEDGLIESHKLERLWNDRCQKDASDQQQTAQLGELRLKILASPPATNPKAFANLVGEGFSALEDKQTTIGIDKLRRAAAMTESNTSLNLFIGEHFFRSGKTQIARTYLSKVHELVPDDVRVSLLLGLACADEGDSETAKKLLATVIERGGSCFAGHYGLGWLHVLENKWSKALTEFKRALKVCPSPEAHFVLASLYYELQRNELAVKHVRKAIQMDETYEEAFNLLRLLSKRTGDAELSREALGKSTSKKSARGKVRKPQIMTRSGGSLFHGAKSQSTGLMTGADRRLATTVREDALRAFLQFGGNSR